MNTQPEHEGRAVLSLPAISFHNELTQTRKLITTLQSAWMRERFRAERRLARWQWWATVWFVAAVGTWIGLALVLFI